MTGIDGLTEEQRHFASHDGEAFVQACPGAGKTRTIIARLARIAETLPPRRGVAILSFTNSAVEEFKERCKAAGFDLLLRYPSFVGTFDSFLGQFLVMPGGMAASTKRPIILDSWDSLGVEVRLRGQYAFRGSGVSLDEFDPETNTIDPDKIGHGGLRAHVSQNLARYERAAQTRRQGLHGAAYLSAGDMRIEARNHIRDPLRGQSLGRALAARFHEVIVDEGQDCNPLDLEILTWLRQHGLRVSIVCDIDQAIYDFRHGNPAELRAMRDAYPENCRMTLSGNFRSSPAICLLAATLRSTGAADTARGSSPTITHPIIVLVYGGQRVGPAIGRAFLAQIEAKGLSRKGVIVLAHKRRVAQRAAGDPASGDAGGTSRVEAVARALAEFWSRAATSRSRENALRSVEKLLLDIMGQCKAGEHPIRAVQRTGLDARLLRRQALTIIMNLPTVCADTDADRSTWVVGLRAEVKRLGLKVPQGQTVRGFFRHPPRGKWSSHLQAPAALGLACSTIHEAKGREYEGVCIVIPPDRAPENYTSVLFDSWENRLDEEAKRVIYVGVTRSRHLCVLAVPTNFTDRCIALLTAGNVPHVRQDLVESD